MANANLRVFADANILIRGITFPRYPYEILRGLLAPGKVMKPGEFLNQVMGWDHEQLDRISRRRWQEIQISDEPQTEN
jgi:hypothetical protein